MKNIFNSIFMRGKHTCPKWFNFSLDNFIRRAVHKQEVILSGYVNKNDYVMDIGPGPGYFSIPMAKMVGNGGKVVAIDIQKDMLDAVQKNAEKNEVTSRILTKLIEDENFTTEQPTDFALAFWMVHEVPNKPLFLQSIYKSLKSNKHLLIAEPYLHVTKKMFDETVHFAETAGFKIVDSPKIFFSHTVLLRKE